MKGAYLLILKNDRTRKIKVGKLGIFKFRKGYYVYVGSAMNSLEKRIERHLRKSKKLKWHIDYLTTKMKIIGIIKIPSEKKIECEIAKFVSKFAKPFIKKFGASDCKCFSHLFKIKKEKIKGLIRGLTNSYKSTIWVNLNKMNFLSS